MYLTKTDMIEYLRCPYRCIKAKSEGIQASDYIESTVISILFERGQQFEDDIVKDMTPVELENIRKSTRNKNLRTDEYGIMHNDCLHISGKIDAFKLVQGIYYPVEIKNHKSLLDTDELEIVFYWLLLNSNKIRLNHYYTLALEALKNGTKGADVGCGYAILNTGEIKLVQVNCDKIEQVRRLLSKIETALKQYQNGDTLDEQPVRTSHCHSCTLADDCKRYLEEKGALSLIPDIGFSRNKQLNDAGINSIKQLISLKTEHIYDKLVKNCTRVNFNLDTIKNWQLTAKAIINESAYPRVPPEEIPLNYAIVDTEYDPGGLVFLTGILLHNGNNQVKQWWAQNTSQHQRNIKEMQSYMQFLKYPIVTYSGLSADKPALGNKIWDKIFGNNLHVDLYQYIKHCWALPLYSLSLKDVAAYTGFTYEGQCSGGADALALYYEWRETKDENIKKTIMEYNAQDLLATQSVIEWLRTLNGGHK